MRKINTDLTVSIGTPESASATRWSFIPGFNCDYLASQKYGDKDEWASFFHLEKVLKLHGKKHELQNQQFVLK